MTLRGMLILLCIAFWVALGVWLSSCAIATGANSVATVGTKSEIKREVAASAPVIEEVFLEKK